MLHRPETGENAQICVLQIWAKFISDDFTIFKENSTNGGTQDGKNTPTSQRRSFWELNS
jgi:hypothetical protein